MKWLCACGLIVLLTVGCGIGGNFRLDEDKSPSADSFPFIIDPVVHLTLHRVVTKEFVFSKTEVSYDYVFVCVYDSSAIEFILRELIVDIPEDTTFYYQHTSWSWSRGGRRVLERAKFCDIPYDDLLEMANGRTIAVYMCGEGYILSTSGKVFGLKEWLEDKKK